MRIIVPVLSAAAALTLAPHLASAAPIAGGALKAAADVVGNVENVTYYGYYRPYRYRPYYGSYGYYRPYRYYGYYNYYRPYRSYGYGYHPYRRGYY